MAVICEIYFYSVILMNLLFKNFDQAFIFSSNSFLVIFLNITLYVYLIFFLFLLLFLFDLRSFKTLSDIKFIFNHKFLGLCFIFILLSLAGMPPMVGFLSKVILILTFFSKFNIFIFLCFIILNFYGIYFYILNLKRLVSKNHLIFFFKKGNNIFLNFFLIFILIFFFIFNLIGLFLLRDLFIFCYFF